MADDPKIVEDPPPARPFGVEVLPDPPPAEPVGIPSPPLDPPPWDPRNVGVEPDGPPWGPRPVGTTPDAPPWRPHEVPVALDPPPADPFDVQVTPDGPPATPFDVQVNPDPAPAAPFQVPIVPDAPPVPPIAVAIVPDPPPAVPFPVGVIPDPPPVDNPKRIHKVEYVPPPAPTAQSIARAVRKFDRQLAEFLLDGIGADGLRDRAAGAIPYSRALDPIFLAEWYKEVLGVAKMARFIAEQKILFDQNDTVARVFNPAYFLAMSVPGSMGHVTAAIGVDEVNNQTVAIVKDAIFRGEPQLDNPQNAFGPDTPYKDGQDFTIGDLVDKAISGEGHKYLVKKEDSKGASYRFDSSAYFDRGPGGTSVVKQSVRNDVISRSVQAGTDPLHRAAATDGIIRVGVRGEDDDGSVRTPTPNPADRGVDDDDAYVPLSFTDLRKAGNAYRSVYFQAMDLNFNMGFAPEYEERGSFGRVDPVVNYSRTTRTVGLSWKVLAFAPEDLKTMYNKMNWLASMVYPSYGQDGTFKSGPVVRLRIGDVVASNGGGLPGVIRSLNFDFSDCLWELKRGMKVPRSYQVQVEFLVLHDGPVGLLDGEFGVLSLGSLGGTITKDTNLAPQTDTGQNGQQFIAGGFMKFGDPRKI